MFRKQVVTRLDSMMFGVVGSYINYFHKNIWIKFKSYFLIVGILFLITSKFILPHLISINGIYSFVFSFTLDSTGILFILPYFSEIKTGNGIIYKLITYLSLISYSMYLINLSIVERLIISNIPWDDITENVHLRIFSNYTLYWLLVIYFSIILYKYFEIPTTSLRERFK
jgi:hypothetical protein